ncbi:MAG TPA: ABC transporter ATP-binding protein [Rariglobus sp.]
MRRFIPYFRYLKPVKWHFVAAMICGILYGAANGAGLPYMAKVVFPRIFGANATPLTNWQLFLTALWLPAIFMFRGAMGYMNTYLIQYCGVHMLESVRKDYFRKLQVLPLAFLQKQTNGDLISRGIADANQLQTSLSNLSNDIIKQPATLIGTVGTLIYLAFKEQGVALVLVCLATLPLCILPIRHFGRKLARRAKELQKQIGSVTNIFSENLGAIREVRAFGLESREQERFSVTTRALIKLQLKATKYAKAVTPSIEVISAIGISITFIYAYKAHIKLDTFLVIMMALYQSYEPIKKLSGLNNDTKRGAAALDRLEAILNEPVTIADPASPAHVDHLKGNLGFERVTFTYKGDVPALNEVTVKIPAGTTCALVGPSGAGKTTFANLVPRFYDAGSGRVVIDGLDVRDMRLADLRRNIALVSQDPVLFNDTIYNNLLLGRQDATRAEVEQAARDAFAHDFIMAMPNGYDTIVGERGASVSGGQRQRLAVARAFLRNAPILILDEATSALDSESEAAIQQALKKLMVGRTVLIIAHRFSTIRDASMILVFDRGHIVASGSHAALYATNALYKVLYDRQSTAA